MEATSGMVQPTMDLSNQRDETTQTEEPTTEPNLSALWGEEQNEQPSNEENQKPAISQQRPTERAIVTLKLDKVTLPTFNGDLTTWEEFRDMFEYLVDSSTKLSDIVKFHQLRTYLRGEAYDTIRGYRMTSKNYKNAWRDLKRRYDHQDEIINSYIRAFLGAPAIYHQANFANLTQIIDATNQLLRALPRLGTEVSNWDPFLTLIIETKLDKVTRQEWKEEKGRNANPDVNKLLNWMEAQAAIYTPRTKIDWTEKLRRKSSRHQHQRHHHQRLFHINNIEDGSNNEDCGHGNESDEGNFIQREVYDD